VYVGRVTQGGGLGGLALGYYQAAPPGLHEGEAAVFPNPSLPEHQAIADGQHDRFLCLFAPFRSHD